MITIYHNTRCSKSRECLLMLPRKDVKVIEYMVTPPTQSELKNLLKKLGMKASELVRKKEELYHQKYEGKKITEAQWLKILSENPVLIERPIIVKGNKAIIGRPPEKLKKFLKL